MKKLLLLALLSTVARGSQLFGAGAGGSGSIGGPVTGGTAGSVLFVNPDNTLAQDNAAFFWNDSSTKLYIGTNSPTTTSQRLNVQATGASATPLAVFQANSSASNPANIQIRDNATTNRVVQVGAESNRIGLKLTNAAGNVATLYEDNVGDIITNSGALDTQFVNDLGSLILRGSDGATVVGNLTGTSLPVKAGTDGTLTKSAVGLTSEVTGTLPVANGGTGLTSGTSGGVLAYTASGTLSSSAALTLHALVVGGGAGAVPTVVGSLGTTATVLHGAAAGDPTFSAIVNGDITNSTIDLTTKVTGILPVANGGTGRATLTNHGVLVGATTTAITQLGAGSAGQVLQSGGASADPAYSTAAYPLTATGTGKFLKADGTNVVFSTATLPDTATGTGTILRADGTNWVATTATFPNTTTANQILYSSATNTVGGISTAATSALVTNSSSVPALTSGSTANRVLRTDGTTISFAQVAAATDISGVLPAANGGTDSSLDIINLGLTATVASNALTINVTDKSGSTPSSTSPVKIGFHNATDSTGQYAVQSITGALSVVVPSGATLGHASGVTHFIYVYLIDNSGTPELAVSTTYFNTNIVVSTTTIGAGSTSNATMYSTTGRSSKSYRVVGRIKVNEATAGTWASAPTEISLTPFQPQTVALAVTGTASGTITGTASTSIFPTVTKDTINGYNTSTGNYTVPVAGYYNVTGCVRVTGTFTAGQAVNAFIGVNGTAGSGNFTDIVAASTGSFAVTVAANAIFLSVGDTVQIMASSSGTSPSYVSNNSFNYFQVTYLGY